MRDRGAKERSQKRERGIVGDTERGNRWKTEKFRFIRHSFHKERHDEKRLHFGPQKREGHHLSKREREREPLSEQSERLEQSPC